MGGTLSLVPKERSSPHTPFRKKGSVGSWGGVGVFGCFWLVLVVLGWFGEVLVVFGCLGEFFFGGGQAPERGAIWVTVGIIDAHGMRGVCRQA